MMFLSLIFHRKLCFLLMLQQLMLSVALAAEDDIGAGILAQDRGRDFGYVVGDVLTHQYLIRVPEDYVLNPSSLPVKGKLDYWLLLRNSDVSYQDDEDGVRDFNLTFEYQTFYAPLDVRRLQIPAIELVFSRESDQIKLTLPDWSFTTSPLKEIRPTGVGNDNQIIAFMKPAITPKSLDTSQQRKTIIFILIMLLVTALAWMLLMGLVPRLNRSPFQQAKRNIRHIQRRGINSAEDYLNCLQAVHHAFNNRVGHSLFEHQLPAFFTQYPQFYELQRPIVDFFEISQEAFFLGKRPQHSVIKTLLKLCDQILFADRLWDKK